LGWRSDAGHFGRGRRSRILEFSQRYQNIRYRDRMKLQLRFNVFNAFNHVRFGAPNTDPTSSNFGRVTLSQQNQARAVELGARLTF
jgi:hypothetical protein